MSEPETIKVLIVNEEGQYLSGDATHWGFVEDRSRAKVFDYIRDHVSEQIRLVRKAYGVVWVAVRLDPREAYEFCDRCGTRIVAFRAYFDGTQFLCAQCKEQSQK
jgi:hypothetical protein